MYLIIIKTLRKMYLENELNYKTSTDYKKLYWILRSGVKLIGFIDLGLKTSKRLQILRYEQKAQMFDFGFIVFFDADFDESKFEKFCKSYEISYIPLDWYSEPSTDCIKAG